MYDVKVLAAAMECPAKGFFMHKKVKPDTVTELQLYFDAVERASKEIAKAGTPTRRSVRAAWSNTVRSIRLRKRVLPASFDFLVGKGAAAVASFADVLLQFEVIRVDTSYRVVGSALYRSLVTVSNDEGRIYIIPVRDFGRYGTVLTQNSPILLYCRIEGSAYMLFWMYAGTVGRLTKPTQQPNDEHTIRQLTAQLDAGINYPRYGLPCRSCPYVKRCEKIYLEAQ